MVILPVCVLSFVRGWDLSWEGFGFGIVWCFLKCPSIALLLDNHIALKEQIVKHQITIMLHASQL